MSITEAGCAVMAESMLDDELAAILSKIEDEDELTPLQESVVAEWRKRRRTEVELKGLS